MKRIDLITSLVLVPVDYLMLIAAGLGSYALRYQSFVTRFRPVFFDYAFSEYLPGLLIVAAIGVFILAFNGSYRVVSNYRTLDILGKVFSGVSTTILLVIVAIFLKRELFSSRFVVVIAWLAAISFVFIGRMVVLRIRSLLLRRGIGVHSLIVLGKGKIADDIALFFKLRPHLGYRVVAYFENLNNSVEEKIRRLKISGDVDEILETRENVDRDALAQIINFAHQLNLNFRYVASLAQTKIINFEIESIGGYPIIQINKTPLNGWRRVYKRTLDIVMSTFGILLLSPLFIVIAMVIKLDSAGPVFVRLRRVGRAGAVFTLYKFRSMVKNAHELKTSMLAYNERQDGPLFKIKDDPRITRLGKFLRRSSLDELPQLWNIFIGDMSLVGPRPHEPEEVRNYAEEYRTLLSVRPGLTGLAQVSGRSNLLFAEEVKIDSFYIDNWSFARDIQIIYRTLFVIVNFNDAA